MKHVLESAAVMVHHMYSHAQAWVTYVYLCVHGCIVFLTV